MINYASAMTMGGCRSEPRSRTITMLSGVSFDGRARNKGTWRRLSAWLPAHEARALRLCPEGSLTLRHTSVEISSTDSIS